jgi:hypothetical protein
MYWRPNGRDRAGQATQAIRKAQVHDFLFATVVAGLFDGDSASLDGSERGFVSILLTSTMPSEGTKAS